jgi:hypothetical protein
VLTRAHRPADRWIGAGLAGLPSETPVRASHLNKWIVFRQMN